MAKLQQNMKLSMADIGQGVMNVLGSRPIAEMQELSNSNSEERREAGRDNEQPVEVLVQLYEDKCSQTELELGFMEYLLTSMHGKGTIG